MKIIEKKQDKLIAESMSNFKKILAEKRSEIIVIADKTKAICDKYIDFKIETKEQAEEASKDMTQIRKNDKQINSIRLTITRPLDDSKGYVKSFADECVDESKETVKSVIVKLSVYQKMEEEKERQKEIERERIAKEEREKAELEMVLSNETPVFGDITKAKEVEQNIKEATVEFKKEKSAKISGNLLSVKYKARVTDISKLDKSYMIPNESMLNSLSRTFKADNNNAPAGVEFYKA